MMDGAEPLRRLLFSGDTMTTSDPLLLQIESIYDQPKLKSMPLREQPAYRITQNPAACNLTELLAAVIGGQNQIELSQALLAHFQGDIRRLYQAHPQELAKVKGIHQATAIRIKHRGCGIVDSFFTTRVTVTSLNCQTVILG